jgi:acyl dehydratase
VVEVLVRTGEVRESPRGTEHELMTEVRDDGKDVVWSGVSTLLAVDRRLPRARTAARGEPRHDHLETLTVPEDVGRRYGRVSGDFNPIHVHPLLARLFGFPRAVAHGMWTLGRSLAALESRLPGGAMTVEVSFRRPLFIPAVVALHWSEGGDGVRFAVTSADGTLTHAEGAVRRSQE